MISRQMPDGSIKQYEDGTPESVMLADYEAMQLKINENTKGLLSDVPQSLQKNWIYDTIAVAPYEGVRKSINSISSLAEGIGDTLGDKFNIGGWRYGKDAENGIVSMLIMKMLKKTKMFMDL